MLNLSLTIGYQMTEVTDDDKWKKCICEKMRCIGFSEPKHIFHSYVHELNGKMQQQVMIAMR